jgi:DHA2 family multidrug resistance protein
VTITLSPQQRLIATFGLVLATLTNTLDMTIANIALPHMQGSLAASSDQMTWVLTSYIVATAIMTPFCGWLAEKIGRKRLFMMSLAGFILASMLCGLAMNLPQIILFRILQGVAGASMMPLSQAALLDMWPRDKTAQVIAVWSAVVTAAPVIGPTLGGYLTETLSWRWAFYINLPLGIVSFLTIWSAMPADAGGRQRRFDYLGYISLVMFLAATQLMMDRGPTLDWFDSGEIRIEAVIAATGLYLFAVQTITGRNPFVPRAIFRDRNFATCMVFGVLLSAVMFASIALMPAFMQSLMGYSAIQAGLATMPRGFGAVLGFVIVPSVAMRLGPRPTMTIGLAISAAALWQMGHFSLTMTDTPIRISGFLQGFGSSLMFNPMSVLSYATLPAIWRNEAAVFSNTLRNIGGSLGIAVMSAIHIDESATVRTHLVAHLNPTNVIFGWRLPELLNAAGDAMAGLSAEVNRQAEMVSYDTAFGYLCWLTLAMLPMLHWMRPARPGMNAPALDMPGH